MKSKFDFSWQNERLRAVVYQIVVLALLGWFVSWLVGNTSSHLSKENIATGFGFLSKPAGFGIGEHSIAYTASSTYARAIEVGIVNTLIVSAWSIFFSTLIGISLGLGTLSKNFIVSKCCMTVVEVFRNTPLLIQLFFWYSLLLTLPRAAFQALHLGNQVYLFVKGLYYPLPYGASLYDVLLAILLAILCMFGVYRYGKHYQARTGKLLPTLWINLGILAVLLLVGYWIGGSDLKWAVPVRRGLSFVGGGHFTPELTALLLGLSLYSASFIAIITRSGVTSIDKGQWEAAFSLGLRRRRVLRLIILPLALRVMIPPLTSNYLNTVKNSSLAIAIGYPDIVSVVNVIITKEGQSVEPILIIMAAYLTVSLSISVLMNLYNRRILRQGGAQ